MTHLNVSPNSWTARQHNSCITEANHISNHLVEMSKHRNETTQNNEFISKYIRAGFVAGAGGPGGVAITIFVFHFSNSLRAAETRTRYSRKIMRHENHKLTEQKIHLGY